MATGSTICGVLPVVAFGVSHLDVLETVVIMVPSIRLVVRVDMAQLDVDTQILKLYC